MPNEKGDNRNNWKTVIVAGAAAAIGVLSYYLGHEVAKQKFEDENEFRDSQAGTSSSTNPHAESTEECSICLKKMKPLKHLHCGHNFHDACIAQWLPLSSTCPLCRAKQQPE